MRFSSQDQSGIYGCGIWWQALFEFTRIQQSAGSHVVRWRLIHYKLTRGQTHGLFHFIYFLWTLIVEYLISRWVLCASQWRIYFKKYVSRYFLFPSGPQSQLKTHLFRATFPWYNNNNNNNNNNNSYIALYPAKIYKLAALYIKIR